MKTLLLLLPVTFIVTAANAQQHATSVVFNDNMQRMSIAPEPVKISAYPKSGNHKQSSTNGRTTSGATNRWYNYGDYLSASSTVNFAANYLWNDTTSVDAYASSSIGAGTEYLFNNIVSVGYVCDPFYFGWNDEALYAGMMQLTPANAYTIDSVFISGIYYRNNARTGPVDTLTVAIVYGDGSQSSDLHYKAVDTSGGRSWIFSEFNVDSLYYMNMHHDSINNRIDTFEGGVTPVIKKIYLTNTDTSANYEATIPVSITVPAGSRPAISVSFKSGDPLFTSGDTVFQSNGTTATYKYGMFRPFIAYEGSMTSPAFPINSPYDLNEGEFRDDGYNRPANELYRPQWFWYNSSTNGASTYQYPYFGFHINCPTCNAVGVNNAIQNITAIKAFPNPANDKVAVSYNLAVPSDVSVSLINMMGQEVAKQKVSSTISGKAVFNTADLPAGIYVYTFNADQVHTTGRFVILH